MKRFLAVLGMLLVLLLPMTGCEQYEPKKEDFSLEVEMSKTSFVQGEPLNYTVKVTGTNSGKFSYKASSTLDSYFFKRVGSFETTGFPQHTDFVTITIPKNYRYEADRSIMISEFDEPGEYLFAVRAFILDWWYDFEQIVTISPA